MRTEWLEYFSDAVRLGSIKASADLHCISPQGLSKSIRSLEAELKAPLFKRNANSVQLTPEGAALLPYVNQTVEAARRLNKQALSITNDASEMPLLVLCSSFVFLCGMVEPLRQGINKLDRQAAFMQADTARMTTMLTGQPESICEGKLLCGFPIFFSPLKEANRTSISQAAEKGYSYLPFLRYFDGILVSKHHPLALQGATKRDEVIRYPVISSNVEQLKPLLSYLGPENVNTAIADMAVRLHNLADNRSVIFVPPFIDAAHDERYSFVPLADAYEVELGFFYDSSHLGNGRMDPLLRSLADFYRPFEQAGLCRIVFR